MFSRKSCVLFLHNLHITKLSTPLIVSKLGLRARIRNILEVAAANGADNLILGAFGCGAFNNPPDLVAGCFRYYLVDKGYRDYFKRVVFAIKSGGQNYEVFRDILME